MRKLGKIILSNQYFFAFYEHRTIVVKLPSVAFMMTCVRVSFRWFHCIFDVFVNAGDADFSFTGFMSA